MARIRRHHQHSLARHALRALLRRIEVYRAGLSPVRPADGAVLSGRRVLPLLQWEGKVQAPGGVQEIHWAQGAHDVDRDRVSLNERPALRRADELGAIQGGPLYWAHAAERVFDRAGGELPLH